MYYLFIYYKGQSYTRHVYSQNVSVLLFHIKPSTDWVARTNIICVCPNLGLDIFISSCKERVEVEEFQRVMLSYVLDLFIFLCCGLRLQQEVAGVRGLLFCHKFIPPDSIWLDIYYIILVISFLNNYFCSQT